MPALSDIIAANVRAERARRKWKQVELAQKLGWSTATVSALEVGTRAVAANDLPLLCRAFGITQAKLMEGADEADLAALGL